MSDQIRGLDPVLGQQIDERAKAALATRLAANGRPADSYTEEEYLEAIGEAQAAIDAERSGEQSAAGAGSDAVRAALLETGLAEAPAPDDATRLLARAHELIAEQGYKEGEYGDVELQSALRVAVADLAPEEFVTACSAVGLDLTEVDTLTVLNDAVEEGHINASQMPAFSSIFATDKTAGARFLLKFRTVNEGGTPESPIYATAKMRQEAAKTASGGIQPDQDTLREDMAAKEILRAVGLVDDRGEIACTADEYIEALGEVRGGPRTLSALGFDSPISDPTGPHNPPHPTPDQALHQEAMDILREAGVTGYLDQSVYEDAVRQARRRLGRGR